MDFQYANVLFGLLFGAGFVVLNVSIVNRILAPKVIDPEKTTTSECGEPTIGSAWVRFDMRFYTVALVFLVFEVEVALLFPWAAAYDTLTQAGGLFAFVEVLLFLVILGLGYVYVWRKGDLDWVKATDAQTSNETVGVDNAANGN